MLRKLVKFVHKDEKGITGLETAIILIAFVVVAAVFAYTVLSAGLFSTQKGQQAVYEGLEEVQATLQMKGAVIAIGNTTGATGDIGQIRFTIEGAIQGYACDFTPPDPGSATGLAADDSDNVVVISYIDQNQVKRDLYWTITKLGDTDEDNLLETDEKFEITVGDDTAGSGAGNLCDALDDPLTVDTTFKLEIKPPSGAVLTIERTTPAWIDDVMDLH